MEIKDLAPNRVGEHYRETEARRSALATQFREAFLADLAKTRGSDRSAAESAMVEIAVSSMLQVVEITARYQRARASDRDQVALADARATLARTLRVLGLTSPSEPAGEPVVDDLQTWIARQTGSNTLPQGNSEGGQTK